MPSSNPGSTISTSELLMSRPTSTLPNAIPAFMVTWSVEEEFGGMTAMCLKRSGMFHDRGIPSAVVTFEARPDLQRIRTSLIEKGKLNPEVPLLNLHEYYGGRFPAAPQKASILPRGTDITWTETERLTRPVDQTLFCIVEESPANKLLSRRTYFRTDQSPYLVDIKVPNPRVPDAPSRYLQLLAAEGSVIAEFSSAAKLYRHWLTEIVDQTGADIIVDSKYSAVFLNAWHHRTALKFYNFHSTHVAAGQDTQTGALTTAHEKIIKNRDDWDGLTFLTESQRTAFLGRFSGASNTQVIGNPVDGAETFPDFKLREPTEVLHVGRLSKGKNVQAAIEIVEAVAASGTPVHLNLIGDGDQRQMLQEFVSTRGIEHLVTFHGFVDNVSKRLDAARVLLLCSKFEGQPLAVMEAQAHGCVPIAFDVDFGPRDMIKNRHNGFLFSLNDKESAAAALSHLLNDDALCATMSQAAFTSAEAFASDENFARWQEARDKARTNKKSRDELTTYAARLAGIRFHADGDFDVDVALDASPDRLTGLELSIRERGSVGEPQEKLVPYREAEGIYSFRVAAAMRTAFPGGEALDLSVEISVDGLARSIRLGAGPRAQAVPYFTKYGNLSIK